MKIVYYKGEKPNFGDELNIWLWPRLFPEFFDEDETDLFLGIGSIIGKNYADNTKKTVFGAGFVSTYNEEPDVNKDDWDVYFVRGPRTAKTLGLEPEKSIGDSAILIREIMKDPQRKPEVVSFMPHWQSIPRGNWEEVCKIANINYIDPRDTVENVLGEILRSKLVITEAMHGAIVSDALRVPWVPLLPINSDHREKWYDWAEALNLELDVQRLWPSSLQDAKEALVRKPALANLANAIDNSLISKPVNKLLVQLTAKNLQKLAALQGSLSDDKIIENVTQRMTEQLCLFKKNKGIL